MIDNCLTMADSAALKKLLDHPALWQAAAHRSVRPVIGTGYSQLDRLLHDGGWPQGALTELLIPQNGVGELKILSPILSLLSKQSGYLVLVAPPLLPYAPFFLSQDIQLDKLLIVQTNQASQAIWACQQALSSRSCAATVCWLPDCQAFKTELRKLALAARQTQAWCFAVRPSETLVHASPAQLRLQLSTPRHGQHGIKIIKQAGGWSGQELSLKLRSEYRFWSAKPANQWPTYTAAVNAPEQLIANPVQPLSAEQPERNASQASAIIH